LARLNSLGYHIENPPYCSAGVLLAKALSVPKCLLLLGECGEYELLFSVKATAEKRFLAEAKNNRLKFYCLGDFVQDAQYRVLVDSKKRFDLHDFNIRARDFERKRDYLNACLQYFK